MAAARLVVHVVQGAHQGLGLVVPPQVDGGQGRRGVAPAARLLHLRRRHPARLERVELDLGLG